jgi:hypothetical protein
MASASKLTYGSRKASCCSDASGTTYGICLGRPGLLYLLINQGCNWQAVEAICEGFPQPDVVSPLALIIESIDSVDGCALMVASQQKEVLRVLDLRKK